MKILGTHSASMLFVRDRLMTLGKDVHPRFYTDIFPALWSAATEHVVDGVGMVAQAGKETGWGHFTGAVTPQFYNTGGIKIRHVGSFPGINDGDRPLAHAMFPNWQTGAVAHAQHLRAYAGAPVSGIIVDPRYTYALKSPISAANEWAELGGKWAPSVSYGVEIEAIMRSLHG